MLLLCFIVTKHSMMDTSNMFKENTVFIVGAGASADYDFPIGEELKQKILNIYSKPKNGDYHAHMSNQFGFFDSNFYHNNFAVGSSSMSSDEFFNSANKLTRTLRSSDSIDRALQTYQNDKNIQLLGKLAIVQEILSAEQKSGFLATRSHQMHVNQSPIQMPINKFSDNSKLEKTWIHKFFRLLVENYPFENRHNIFENVTIICFNYDRCIEYYLIELVLGHFGGIERKEALDIVKTLTIFHPYGTLGQLFDQTKENYMPFGAIGAHQTNWINFSSEILTFTETSSINGIELENYRNKIKTADSIIHLGFGLENMNCDLYTNNGSIQNTSAELFSTAYGLNTDQINDFNDELYGVYGNQMRKIVYDMNSSDFLTHISRRIKK